MAINAPPAEPVFAFRCRNCGNMVPAEHAGQNDVPHACPTCHAGVSWAIVDGQPQMTLDPDNWQVLADLPPEELAAIVADTRIDPATQIARHTPFRTVATRLDDTTEEVTHLTPVEHFLGAPGHNVDDEGCPRCREICDVCRVNRPGTTTHKGGKVDTVTNPNWQHDQVSLDAPLPPSGTPQNLTRSVAETPASEVRP